jgi:hypothetical protein
MSTATALEDLVKDVIDALGDAPGEAAPEHTTMRERFFELIVVILGNLYNKSPVAAPLFDRATMQRVTTGMDDSDAGRLTGRCEDWLRLEGLLRQQDGAKAYFVTRLTMAILSTATAHGPLGDVMDKVLKRYQQDMPSMRLREASRQLASYFLMRVAA